VKDLLSDKFVQGTNVEAGEIAIALRQLISGQSLMLQNQQSQAQEMARIREHMHEIDVATEKWETDKMAFLQEVADKAEHLRSTNPDRIIANGVQVFQDALIKAKAEVQVDKMKFHEMVSKMPKETVISPGELITALENKRPVNKIVPEIIRIKDMQWVLPPGVPVEVPSIVAAAIRDRRKTTAESQARENMMSLNLEQSAYQTKWAEINDKFRSPTK